MLQNVSMRSIMRDERTVYEVNAHVKAQPLDRDELVMATVSRKAAKNFLLKHSKDAEYEYKVTQFRCLDLPGMEFER